MLAKVIKLKKAWKSVARAANYIADDSKAKAQTQDQDLEPFNAANYIARDGVFEAASFNLEGLNPTDPDDRRQIIKLMDGTARAWAARSRAKADTNPFYHVVLSWKDGERPNLDQATAAAAKALKAVGMSDNQAFFAIHRDGAHHHHIHIIANRAHPDHLVLTGPPQYDFLTLDRTCREIELEQGWQHDNGPNVAIDGQIKRLTHSQRHQLGMQSGKTHSPHAPSVKARMGEVHAGLPSLAGWLRNKVAPELVAAQNWHEFHMACAARGLSVIKVQSGLLLETAMLNKPVQTKASAVHYSLGLGRLQNRFGQYEPPVMTAAAALLALPANGPIYGTTYNDYVARVACGIDPDSQEHPGRTGHGEKRTLARNERAQSRAALFEQYKHDKFNAVQNRSTARASMRAIHKLEKADLLRSLTISKAATVHDLKTKYGDQVARSLWAAQKTGAIEELTDRQKNERLALTHAHSMDWLPWLERQAGQGNEAAISALRGIRYQAQRDQNKSKAGFEGEDLFPVKKQVDVSQTNAIAGETRSDLFSIRTAVVRVTDHNSIEYLDNSGAVRLTDTGPRVDLAAEDDMEAIRAGLQLASQKFGGEVFITGSLAFRELAAKEASALGIKVKNPELDHIKTLNQSRMDPENER